MTSIEALGLQQAEATIKGIPAQGYSTLLEASQATATAMLPLLREASPTGDYDEPGFQQVPRNPGEVAAGWHAIQENQFTWAVVNNIWYTKLLLFAPSAQQWLITPKQGRAKAPRMTNAETKQILANRRYNMLKRPSGATDMLLFGGPEGDVYTPQALRHPQQQNEELRAALEGAGLVARAQVRALFERRMQEYVRIKSVVSGG